jgi:hypothetical protein
VVQAGGIGAIRHHTGSAPRVSITREMLLFSAPFTNRNWSACRSFVS